MKMFRRIIAAAAVICLPLLSSAQATDYVIEREKDAAAFAAADWHWHSIGRQAEAGTAHFRMFDCAQCISVVRYKPSRYSTDLLHCPDSLRSTPSRAGSQYGAIAALNGSYFNMRTLYPTTYIKDDGVQKGHTTPGEMFRINGALCLRNPHKASVVEVGDTTAYNADLRRYREALTSGPLLVDDGRSFSYDDPGSFFTHRHPRTMFGVDRKGWIYMVVVDGRFPGQADGATIAEMVFLAECFGLVEAINLDGGGSSALWTAVDGVISYPRDNGVFDHAGEREVPNIILVR